MKEKPNPFEGLTSDERIDLMLKMGTRPHKTYRRRTALERARARDAAMERSLKRMQARQARQDSIHRVENLRQLVRLNPDHPAGVSPLNEAVRVLQTTSRKGAWKIYFDGKSIWAGQAVHILRNYSPKNK